MKIMISLLVAASFSFFSCQNKNTETTEKQQPFNNEKSKTEIKITSSSFKEGDLMPAKYTCTGENISPQISWSDIPQSAKSLAIIVDDPDAPAGGLGSLGYL